MQHVGQQTVGRLAVRGGVSSPVPKASKDVSQYLNLVKGLIEMGYSDPDIRKIMGLNLVRVMRAAEEVAARP